MHILGSWPALRSYLSLRQKPDQSKERERQGQSHRLSVARTAQTHCGPAARCGTVRSVDEGGEGVSPQFLHALEDSVM